MLKYPLSTLLYIAKINIKDTIKDALRLKNNLDIRLTVTVKDKNGKIIKQHKQHSHSFLMNFAALLATAMLNYNNTLNNYYYFRITSGTWYSIDQSYTNVVSLFDILDNANESLFGIVVGTGTATPTPNDFELGNQIVNGTGSGQLIYNSHTISPTAGTSGLTAGSTTPTTGILTPSGNTTSFQVSRTFQNQSGASITVSEVGIMSLTGLNGSVTYPVLLIHDLLSSPITIPNMSILSITYTISVTT